LREPAWTDLLAFVTTDGDGGPALTASPWDLAFFVGRGALYARFEPNG
jgi:hypothetical protein